MASSTAVNRSTRRRAPAKRGPPTDGWWGAGPAPWERWPGVSIRLEAVWSVDRNRWETPDGRYYFDPEAAALGVDFFPELLVHHKGEFVDQPFHLMPYQDQLVVRPLFGWKRASDGLRRFRKVFLAVPKGNGKSPLAAGIGLKLTFSDGEPGAEVIAAAADKDQAAVVFDTAKVMVEESEDLDSRANIFRRAIEVPSTRSYFRVVSADVKSKHGPNIHGLVVDEFHAQPTRELYETLHRGTVKRRQPVTFLPTTAGDDDESICAEEWDYARKVIGDPSLDESYLPIVFEASKDDNWKDPAVWARVNPGFGVTVKADAIEAECRAAQIEPRKLNDFLRFHLNRWVNQATAWIPVDWWDACEVQLSDAELVELAVFGGLDMTQKHDLASLVLTFPRRLPEGQTLEIEVVAGADDTPGETRALSLNFDVAFVPFFWIPEDTMREHEKTDKVPYDQWVKQGLVTATPGAMIDINRICKDITGPISKRFPRLRGTQIRYDPAFATDVALRLLESGYQMVELLQNYKYLSEPAHVLEALLKARRVRQAGHRTLRWNVENVSIKTDDAGRIRPVKPRRKAKRIDGVVAALMGLSGVIGEPWSAGTNFGMEFI